MALLSLKDPLPIHLEVKARVKAKKKNWRLKDARLWAVKGVWKFNGRIIGYGLKCPSGYPICGLLTFTCIKKHAKKCKELNPWMRKQREPHHFQST